MFHGDMSAYADDRMSIFRVNTMLALTTSTIEYPGTNQITSELIARNEADKLTGFIISKAIQEAGCKRTENLPRLCHSFDRQTILMKDVFCFYLKCLGLRVIVNPLTKLFSKKVGEMTRGENKVLKPLF